jgi:deoxyribodipyrimidine photolyase-related protein
LAKIINSCIEKYNIEKIWIFASEYRLDVQLQSIGATLTIPSEAFDSEHFTLRHELAQFFEGKSYCWWKISIGICAKHHVLMDGSTYRQSMELWSRQPKKYKGEVPVPWKNFNADVTGGKAK